VYGPCCALVVDADWKYMFVGRQGVSGGTTVSATMLAAHMAGVEVFVTGGIGGIHRDVQTCMITRRTRCLWLSISSHVQNVTYDLFVHASDIV